MSIKLEHVNYIYGEGTAYEKHALKDINLEIPDGQFLGIIGHTGSGKSTLIQHLNGLIKATSCVIYYSGENIYAEGYSMKELRSHVGLVFQYPEYQLFEEDVLSDVCFGPKNLGLSEEEVKMRSLEALHQVGLKEKYYDKSPFDLSGGQKRRVAIVILVSHSMEDVAKYVDRIIVMDHGCMKFDGEPKKVFEHYKELESIGLSAPQVTYVMQDLKEKGFDVDVHAITVEEAKQSILQAFGMKVKKNGSEENV